MEIPTNGDHLLLYSFVTLIGLFTENVHILTYERKILIVSALRFPFFNRKN